MTKSHKKLDAVCEGRALRATVAVIAVWATLAAACLAADDQHAPADNSVPKSLIVSGMVRDALVGKPIEGAKITIQQIANPDGDQKALKPIEAVSDADGKYTFTLPTDQPWKPTTNSRGVSNDGMAADYLQVDISVNHPDYAPQHIWWWTIPLTETGTPNAVDGFAPQQQTMKDHRQLPTLELRPGKEVTGVLQSPDGRPLVGVRVFANSQVPKNERELVREPRRRMVAAQDPLLSSSGETRTDDSGHFHIGMITPGEGMLLIYPEKDFAPLVKILYDRRGDLGVIKLQPGPEIKGRVVDADGKPIAGLNVSIDPWDPAEPKYSGENVVQQTTRVAKTDADGNFSASPLAPGQYRVEPKQIFHDPTLEWSNQQPLSAMFVPQKLTIIEGQSLLPVEVRATATVSIEGSISLVPQAGFGGGQGFLNGTFPIIEGTLNGMAFRVNTTPDSHRLAAGERNFKAVVPLGLKDTTITLSSREIGWNNILQPQWRLGKDGPLQSTTKIRLGTLTKDFKDLEIVYGTPGDPNQPQPAAVGRGRAAQPAGRAARGGARGQAAPVPVPADTNDDPNSK